MKRIKTISALLAIAALTACGSRTIEDSNKREFTLTYVSGHLGSYDACPEKALDPAPEPGAAGAPAPCRSNDGNCKKACIGETCDGIFPSCTEPTLRLQVKNVGLNKINQVSVIHIELLNDDGSVHSTLDAKGVFDSSATPPPGSQNASFNLSIEPDNMLRLTIVFNRPLAKHYGKVRIRILGDNAEQVLTTPDLSSLPSVAT